MPIVFGFSTLTYMICHLQVILFTDVETKVCTDTSPLIMGAVGGVMCLIIVTQSLAIALLLQQNKQLRFGKSSYIILFL